MRIGSYIKQKQEATMKKALLLFVMLVLLIPAISNAQSELWVDTLRVTLTGTDNVSIYQEFYSRKATRMDTISFATNMTGVLNGYNDGTCVARIDSMTASMDTDSIQWKIQKLAHDGTLIDSANSTFYVNSSNALTTTLTWLDWTPTNDPGDNNFPHWVDLTGEMIDPHCVGLKHTITTAISDVGGDNEEIN
jgi:hypothetical protein